MNESKDFILSNLTQVIGEGAFSVVYKVFVQKENTYYAVKEVNVEKLSIKDLDNLEREIFFL